MFTRIRHILEMIRFSHTLFALPFALLAAIMAWRKNRGQCMLANWAVDVGNSVSHGIAADIVPRADGWFRWQDLLGLVLCMVTGRSAAMALNRLADREFDALNPRTAGRHLPAGTLSARSVAGFAVATSVAFIVSTLVFLPNLVPLYLSIPTLLILFGYS